MKNEKIKETPITEKLNITIKEAAEYSNIGINKLYELTDQRDCPFVVWIYGKRFIRRKAFEEYIDKALSI